jgi:hypothetical protein
MRIPMHFDLTVYDDAGRPRVTVEIKRSLGTNAAWAAQLRRNWLEHGLVPAADLFVIVLPDRLYLWRGSPPPSAFPDVDVDARPVFAPYFQRVATTPEKIYPEAFDMLVAWWLEDLATQTATDEHLAVVPAQLRDAIAGGHIVFRAAA